MNPDLVFFKGIPLPVQRLGKLEAACEAKAVAGSKFSL